MAKKVSEPLADIKQHIYWLLVTFHALWITEHYRHVTCSRAHQWYLLPFTSSLQHCYNLILRYFITDKVLRFGWLAWLVVELSHVAAKIYFSIDGHWKVWLFCVFLIKSFVFQPNIRSISLGYFIVYVLPLTLPKTQDSH